MELGGQLNVHVDRVGGDAHHGSELAIQLAGDQAHGGAILALQDGDLPGGDLLVGGTGHLQVGGQVDPQLETLHLAVDAFGHLLVQDAAAGGHPLHVARTDDAGVAEAVAVGDGAFQHISDGLDAAVGVGGETGEIVGGVIRSEVVEEQEGVGEIQQVSGEAALQAHAGAFKDILRVHHLAHGAGCEAHGLLLGENLLAQ